MKIAVVIAAYNESATIRPLTTRLVQALDAIEDTSWKLIYVIDGTDGTVEIAREFAAQRPEIQILHNERGFQAIPDDTDYVVTMDADLNHQPEEIVRLLTAARESGADVVVGSRRVQQSTVEGMPLWKSALSKTVNRMMHFLMGTRVNDLTSGFRVYRAAALRQIHFESVGFAFLPEILVDAASKRFTIVEEPIRFVFRDAGESKMQIPSTSLSYVRLFATRSVGVTVWLTIAVLLIGIGFRIAFCFPAHRFESDADAVLAGQCAFEVADGQTPLFFPGGFRLSSQSCYVTAAMFGIFGPTRSALGATSVFYGTLFLVFSWLALREAGGMRAAVWGLLLVALPPYQFWMVAYPAWGYPEILACCACTLWLGFRLLRPHLKHPIREAFWFGLCLGYSFWTSPQTVMVSVPVVLLLLWKRRLPWRSLAVTGLSALLPLYPYFLVVAYRGTSPFTTSFATRPVSGATPLIANVQYLFVYTLPVLFFSQTAGQLSIASISGIRLVLVLCLLVALTVVVLRSRAGKHPARATHVPALFPLGILLLGCAVYAVSGAGTIRGWTVRYAVPLWLIVPLATTLLYHQLHKRRAKAVVIVCAIALAGLQMVEYPIFNRQARGALVAGLAENKAAVSWLHSNQLDLAIGDYWTVYPLNFDGGRSVIALPLSQLEDYLHYDRELEGRQVRAALLDVDSTHLEVWAKRIGRPGHIERVNDSVAGFVFDQPLDSAGVEQARAAAK
jgi:dolichol-phosphate mannosyltransferase